MPEQKKDVSIEYAHIYTNNKIGDEQRLSIKILGNLKAELETRRQTYSLTVLVDDYSFPDPSFNYEDFISCLEEEGFPPDIVMRESQLIPLCDQVLTGLKDVMLKDQIIDYIKTKKYPCSLFIAAWYLLRLGYLKHDSFNKSFIAEKLINILPQSSKPFEDKGLEIIAASEFAGAEKSIEYSFIEGRLIA